jgi:metal-responsive CopG/Arc/MetJ family transcriptional regulator
MAKDVQATSVQKVTVTLPKKLLKRLDEFIPRRQRSRFIATAIQEHLAMLEQLAALEESAGAWTNELHPEMQTEADIDRWLAQLRSG